MLGLSRGGAGGHDGSRTPTSADRLTHRSSWSSDDRASSSNSISSKERQSLWGKLRKHAGLVHTSRSAQLDHHAPPGPLRAGMPLSSSVYYGSSRASLSSQNAGSVHATSRPSLALQHHGSAHTLPRPSTSPHRLDSTFAQSRPSTASTTASGAHVSPRPSTSSAAQPQGWRSSTCAPVIAATPLTATVSAAAAAAAATAATGQDSQERLIQSVSGLERLKLIAALGGDSRDGATKGGDHDPLARGSRTVGMQPSSRPPPFARGSVDVFRGSADVVRESADVARGPAGSQSMELARPAANHSNPDDISADSIRQMLGAYTGKTEVKGKPRLRRLMMLSPNARRDPLPDMQGLECIAEDDEQPATTSDGHASAERREQARRLPRAADAAKRLSDNSGSTASSGDTLCADADSRSPRPRLWASADGTLFPAPKREQQVPVAHRQAADWGMKLDPVVYRNTFFNARPSNDQQQPWSAPGPDTMTRGAMRTAAQPASASAGIGPSSPMASPPLRLRRPSEPGPRPPTNDADAHAYAHELDRLRWTIRILQSRNEMLSELVVRDPMEAVPESVRIHMRTIELENAWLRRELVKRPKNPH
ncbi:hypothetical protein LPJ61_002124 [Coemansia biformis]|uniref:Uncharacterized protein n=1 Tax=Coemansia biformis TaxID=1286918 RepID=A0A9W8CZG6_9FUNG|nr:hypothetical protein LPJ61_002124 [Coemansia biformis]